MKLSIFVAVLMLGTIPAFGQDQSSCKAYFQVLRSSPDTPGLTTGLDGEQERWWGDHKKDYPGLCLDGSIASADKPRYLVIWSKSKTIANRAATPSADFSQPGSALQNTAPTTAIYQAHWNVASITILNITYDGKLENPPVYVPTGDRIFPGLVPYSPKVLKVIVQYLAQEPAFLPSSTVDISIPMKPKKS